MFKKGDKVRCVDNDDVEKYLDNGCDYTIRAASEDAVFLEENLSRCFFNYRFELIPPVADEIQVGDEVELLEDAAWVAQSHSRGCSEKMNEAGKRGIVRAIRELGVHGGVRTVDIPRLYFWPVASCCKVAPKPAENPAAKVEPIPVSIDHERAFFFDGRDELGMLPTERKMHEERLERERAARECESRAKDLAECEVNGLSFMRAGAVGAVSCYRALTSTKAGT